MLQHKIKIKLKKEERVGKQCKCDNENAGAIF